MHPFAIPPGVSIESAMHSAAIISFRTIKTRHRTVARPAYYGGDTLKFNRFRVDNPHCVMAGDAPDDSARPK
jgi:hypothetical protein